MYNEFALILGMFVITFGIRYSLFAFNGKVKISPFLQEALSFVPVSVLTAIIVPAMFKNPNNDLSMNNPYFVGTVVASLVAYKTKNINLTIVLGFVAFYLFKYFAA